MRLELYQAETTRIATEQTALLDEAHQVLVSGKKLSRLEENGVLHALQLLIENSIGKTKQILKAAGHPVPISAYNAFESLAILNKIDGSELEQWNLAIGLRNRIVHEYMNIDIELVRKLIIDRQYLFITKFLCQPIPVCFRVQ